MIHLLAALTITWMLSASPVSADDCTASPSGTIVKQWSGTGDRNTEPFTATGAPLKMTYTTTGPVGVGPQLCWRMRGLDGKTGPGGCIQQESGETFVYLAQGQWYLEIKPMGDFSVTLEQL